jgi:hypothetical protein
LIYSSGVAVSLEECEELAKSEGYPDKWTAAAHYASAMLPAIFRPLDPLMQVEFAAEDRIKLESVLDDIENSIFEGEDSLGWVYQFWQSDIKDAINKSDDKINGERLPAVTQLFTEPYMVHFLIDNTIGAWWVSRHPKEKPPVSFEYLRLLEDGLPAAGRFDGWPEKASEITVLDPCMGSGHFVVSVYQVLVRLRMFEDHLTPEEASNSVIKENLHGLEIDPRCTQIAAFNLALASWKFCGHYKELPEMNLACCGIAPKGKKEDWVKLVGKEERPDDKARLENGIRVLYNNFQLAPELGSLLDLTTIKADAFTASFEELQPILKKALESELDNEQIERGVIAAGIAKSAVLLNSNFTLIITNVPFVGTRKQGDIIKKYCEKYFPKAKHDLATCMIQRNLKLIDKGGNFAFVSPHNWLFLGAYMGFRKELLKEFIWNFAGFLGPRSFRTPMYDFSIGLIVLTNSIPSDGSILCGINVENSLTPEEKSDALIINRITSVKQLSQLNNPDHRITLEANSGTTLFQQYVSCLTGVLNGDSPKFIKNFWEFNNWPIEWIPLQGTATSITPYGGREQLIYFDKLNGHLREDAKIRRERLHDSDQRGNTLWGKKGVMVHRMGSLPATLYLGDVYDQNGAVIVPNKNASIEALWAFIISNDFNKEVRKLDNKVGVTPATLAKVPFDIQHWTNVATEKFPYGLPKPYSDDATQWLFHGHPQKAENPLQVAAARLLGYNWPAENDVKMELSEEARTLINSIRPFDYLADDDGIICIPSVNNETSASERLREYLQVVLGDQYNNNTIAQLLEKEGSKKNNLEDWLRDEYFDQHCKLFHNRPFIWHIWDGRKDGFSALVNYHKLTKENLRKLIYTYLGDWIRQCEFKNKKGESGSEGLLSAALKLKEKLEKILEGEVPFDIFVRWKPIEKQSVGWDPDLNDGVRLNIRPFITADVLRKKPNIKWGIDRGKNPKGSPWGEIRDNDRHLTLEEKRTARDKKSN